MLVIIAYLVYWLMLVMEYTQLSSHDLTIHFSLLCEKAVWLVITSSEN